MLLLCLLYLIYDQALHAHDTPNFNTAHNTG